LTAEFGNGFSVRNLRAMRQFYLLFPIPHAVRAELKWTNFFVCERHSKSHRIYQSAMFPYFEISFKNPSHFSREQFGLCDNEDTIKKDLRYEQVLPMIRKGKSRVYVISEKQNVLKICESDFIAVRL
jgi:hypothetical protein